MPKLLGFGFFLLDPLSVKLAVPLLCCLLCVCVVYSSSVASVPLHCVCVLHQLSKGVMFDPHFLSKLQCVTKKLYKIKVAWKNIFSMFPIV